MKLLVLTPQYPFPLHQGTSIRNFHLLKYLATHHDVHLLTFDSPLPEGWAVSPGDPLPDLCRQITRVPTPTPRSLRNRAVTTVSSFLPDMALRLDCAAMQTQLDRLTRDDSFDVIQIEGIEMAPFALRYAQRRAGQRPRLVFDDHNAEYVLQRSAHQTDLRNPRRWIGALYSWFQWTKLERYESLCCRTFDRVLAVSHTDAAALQALSPELTVTVLPNGVDTEAYRPQSLPDPFEPLLVYTGKMDFRPNVDAMLWFCNQILPRVVERVPAARLTIVGQRPHPRLHPLAQLPHVQITGHVPNVQPYIAEAALFIVPLRMGGGTRLKVLEAMAMSKAIVSTSLGCEGLGVTSGQELLLADDPKDFADQIVHVLQNPAEAHTLGRRARAFVEARYAWNQLTPMLENVIGET